MVTLASDTSSVGNGSVLLWMLEFFLFVIWFWLLIAIFSDLFRDHDVSGGVKALWVILLIVLPFIGILAYLIFRGHGMAARSAKQQQAAQQQVEARIREVAGGAGVPCRPDRAGQVPARLRRDQPGRVRQPEGQGPVGIERLRCRRVPLGDSPDQPPGDRYHDERADQRAEHTTPIEDVRVADAEQDREDQVPDQGTEQAQCEGDKPGLGARHVAEDVAGDEHASDDTAEQTEQERADHDFPQVKDGVRYTSVCVRRPPPRGRITRVTDHSGDRRTATAAVRDLAARLRGLTCEPAYNQ